MAFEHGPLSLLRAIVRPSGALNVSSHAEKWISGLGGFIALFALFVINAALLDGDSAVLVVASMGATAVLLFAVPHGALSQPWPLIGGHTVSALIGVSCALWFDNTYVAAGAAVGLAIFAMHYLRCIHPPGGATALVAVMGGEAIHQLGYLFVVTPVLSNALLMLLVAVVVNLPFKWRRYPACLVSCNGEVAEEGRARIAHEDLVYALTQIDSFIDVNENDLLRIYNLAIHRSQEHDPVPCYESKEECDLGDGCICHQLGYQGH